MPDLVGLRTVYRYLADRIHRQAECRRVGSSSRVVEHCRGGVGHDGVARRVRMEMVATVVARVQGIRVGFGDEETFEIDDGIEFSGLAYPGIDRVPDVFAAWAIDSMRDAVPHGLESANAIVRFAAGELCPSTIVID
ncbi:hypothetical protein NLM24_09915 [Nocardia zapadnayensis]|uniref:hypothetical protein n=1 Tax=Nocardia rhamnosiphila TaxID=426716 RepID=UPI0022473844|nr:hypothetical protein [Nocardia zapadnayensis]MCX0271014.1 hypothetical protein [Nocardia zapadnayensis]